MTEGIHSLLCLVCVICHTHVGAGKELISLYINFKRDREVSGCIKSATKTKRGRGCEGGPLTLLYFNVRASPSLS